MPNYFGSYGSTILLRGGYKRDRIFATFPSYLVFFRPPDTLPRGALGKKIKLGFVVGLRFVWVGLGLKDYKDAVHAWRPMAR